MGTRVVRTEDPRLLTRGGVYVDDLRLPELAGAVYATFVRSPVAHALIKGIDATAAREHPGVVAVITAADLAEPAGPPGDAPAGEAPAEGAGLDAEQAPGEAEQPAGESGQAPESAQPEAAEGEQAGDGEPPPGPPPPPPIYSAEPLLAEDRVRYVGEPVALVLTEDRYAGEDAADLVSVDYEPLPPVVDIAAALADGSLLFPGTDSNIAQRGSAGNLDEASFDGCEVVVERTIVNQRLAPVPLEVRSAAAVWAGDRLTVWVSTQNAQISRAIIAGNLHLDPGQVRVITPDVGGGFGAKVGVDRDPVCVAGAARLTGRPVRWVESRSENLVGMVHGRAQRQTYKIGGTRDGRILAYHLDIVQDCGAYTRFGAFLAWLTQLMSNGAYDIPHVGASFRAVVTNTTPISAYRGAGRPEATAAIERAVDDFAAGIGMDPAEVRRRNVPPPEAFPFTTKTGAVYDSGAYAAAIDKVLAAAGYDDLRAEQARRRERGDARQLGLGLSCYVEITAADAPAGETARLAVDSEGGATVYTGTSPHGQGHHTAWAMLVQDELGIPMEQVRVVHGDTDAIPEAIGTYGSRSLQLGGSAVHQAAVEVKQKARQIAADMIEASADDLEFDVTRGAWQVRGDPAASRGWAEIARQAGGEGLVADVRFTASSPTFPFGAHLSVVEVDTETGKVTLTRHMTVDDAGKILNPVLAEGQRHGGIAQGAAQALLEEVRYDADGNPLTSTLADYAAITATELPSFELVASETPTTVNPLGAKGIGEAGTIGATPAVQNAVIDAVSHLGVRHIDMPATPERVWAAINEERAGQ